MPSRGGSGGQCQPRLEISSWQARSQPPAGLRADPAMLVHLRVPAALAGAGPASGRAGLERGAGEAGVLTGVPRQHPAGSAAEAGAVQAGADAPDQAGYPGLAQARVGARGTGLGAPEAFADTPGQCCAVDVAEVGVGAQHLLCMGHRYLPSSMLVQVADTHCGAHCGIRTCAHLGAAAGDLPGDSGDGTFMREWSLAIMCTLASPAARPHGMICTQTRERNWSPRGLAALPA
jgi:hypothetical protein